MNIRGKHEKDTKEIKYILWQDIKCSGVDFKGMAEFTEADYPKQLANRLKMTNLRLARRKPCIRG